MVRWIMGSMREKNLLGAEVNTRFYVRDTVCNSLLEKLPNICAPNWGEVDQALRILVSIVKTPEMSAYACEYSSGTKLVPYLCGGYERMFLPDSTQSCAP